MSQAQLEKDNEAVVNAMIAVWEAKDLEGIRATLAEDIVYQMHESIDDMTSADAVCTAFEPAMAAERVEWEVSRSYAIGSVVINERIDKFYSMPDGKGGTMDVIAAVAGFFYVKDGKIAMWRDYSIPVDRQNQPEQEGNHHD